MALERTNTAEPFLVAMTRPERLLDMRKHVKRLYMSGEIDLIKAIEVTLQIERLEP